MPDDRIYDAINLFKDSPTGIGTADFRGDRRYQDRYRQLARNVLTKLWQLWAINAIGFSQLPRRQAGRATNVDGHGGTIKIHVALEPPQDPADYGTSENQGKLAATSCEMVHEAVHLVHNLRQDVEEEVLCRTIQAFYFHDLQAPRTYQSRITGTLLTAQYLPTTPLYEDMKTRYKHLRAHDLVDEVIAYGGYADLDAPETATFIARSLEWWGGPRARWVRTRRDYIRALAAQGDQYAELILQVLESFSRSQWQAAKAFPGLLSMIRSSLRSPSWTYPTFATRLRAVEQTLRESIIEERRLSARWQ
jgi:hypothetical protein